jgi:hypothetical protein
MPCKDKGPTSMPRDESPTTMPCDKSLTTMPCKDKGPTTMHCDKGPRMMPRDKSPTTMPRDESLTTMPCKDKGSTTMPRDEGPTTMPRDEDPTRMLLADSPVTDAFCLDASLSMRAKNDPSEGNFATFTDVLCNSGWISIDSATGIGQAQYDKDLDCNHGCYVTGQKGRRTDQSTENGALHALPKKLQDSLLAVAKKNGNKSRKQLTASLHRQRAAHAEKVANAIAMKLQSTEKDLINISYLHQKYFSLCCWKTVCQALDEFKKLASKKDNIEGANINQISWAWVGRSSSLIVGKKQVKPTKLYRGQTTQNCQKSSKVG